MTSDITDDLVNGGYGVVTLDGAGRSALSDLLGEACAFFDQPADSKKLHASADGNHGYRSMGQEYSLVPERPDMIESFVLWFDRTEFVPGRELVADLLSATLAWREVAADLTRNILSDLARMLGASPVPFERASQVQVNNCLSHSSRRELLHDRHEDGHIITLLHCTGPGLDLFAGGSLVEATFGPDEVLVLPGSTLTALTGGLIEPLEHRVRNLRLASRQAVMYFVNPELSDPVFPWAGSDEARSVDLREAIRSRPAAFGLPSVPVL